MSSINPGKYTVEEIFNLAGFDLEEKAAADYSPDGIDRRKVKIGGLPFDNLDEVVSVPESANKLEITVDGVVDTVLNVE